MHVYDLPVGKRGRERVYGEVAAPEILLERGDELHAVRMARIIVAALGAECGYLIMASAEDDGDGPVPDARIYRASEELLHLIRLRIGREVIVIVLLAENRIAHRAANEIERETRIAENGRKLFNVPGYPHPHTQRIAESLSYMNCARAHFLSAQKVGTH